MSHYNFNAGIFFFCLFLLYVFLLGFILFWVVGGLQGQRSNRKGRGNEGDWNVLHDVKSTINGKLKKMRLRENCLKATQVEDN